MKKYVTGCIYAIDFQGTEEYEFKGIHPAMIVRMLKEEKMYYVVPLTTYTKERWEKCKRQGFGCRILSTNSIARVDKLNVIPERQIQKRYYNSGKIVCANPEEIEKVILRVEEYLKLANRKGMTEYNKYFLNRSLFSEKMRTFLLEQSFENICYNVVVADNTIEIAVDKQIAANITFNDIVEILFDLVNAQNIELIKGSDLTTKIKFSMDKENLLTFKEKYDKFKIQKGDKNI